MNDTKLRQSIQRWEYEGGALLPPDCNVHFWHDPRRQSTSDWQHAAENHLTASQEFTGGPIAIDRGSGSMLTNN